MCGKTLHVLNVKQISAWIVLAARYYPCFLIHTAIFRPLTEKAAQPFSSNPISSFILPVISHQCSPACSGPKHTSFQPSSLLLIRSTKPESLCSSSPWRTSPTTLGWSNKRSCSPYAYNLLAQSNRSSITR